MKRILMIAGTALLVSGCGGGSSVNRSFETAPAADGSGVADYPVKIGEPYELGGVTYTPSDAFNYDETGYASWYGQELAGRNTANGELFNAEGISGAHRTLPLPSYAEVTALDTGKTILVRLNDRGPSMPDRLIDLSQGAARQLGILDKGAVAVRVRRVNPPESERALLRQGQPVAMRMETPESLLVPLRRRLDGKAKPAGLAKATAPMPAPASDAGVKPKPEKAKPEKARPVVAAKPVTPVPAAKPAVNATSSGRFIVEGEGTRPAMAQNSTGDNRATMNPAPAPATPKPEPKPAAKPAAADGNYFVQVAAFGSRARADELAKRIGAVTTASANGKVFRVRYGPYANADAAQQGLTLAKRNGYQGVRIQKDTDR